MSSKVQSHVAYKRLTPTPTSFPPRAAASSGGSGSGPLSPVTEGSGASVSGAAHDAAVFAGMFHRKHADATQRDLDHVAKKLGAFCSLPFLLN
jgi:hypothetical protein